MCFKPGASVGFLPPRFFVSSFSHRSISPGSQRAECVSPAQLVYLEGHRCHLTVLSMPRFLLAALLLLAACADPQPEPTVAPEATDAYLFPITQDGKWGYIDVSGAVVIAPQYDLAWDFSEGLALARQGSQYGYIDKTGAWVIAPQYTDAWYFSEGLAPVETSDGWVYIDRSGTVVVEPDFELAQGMLEENGNYRPREFGLVRVGNQYGFRNAEGEVVVEPQYEQAWHFSEGLARVKKNDQWGYIDRTGALVIAPQYDRAWDFRQGLALVQTADGYGYIKPDGTYAWEPSR